MTHPDGFCLRCRGGDRWDQCFCDTMPSGTKVDCVTPSGYKFVILGTGPADVAYDGRSPASSPVTVIREELEQQRLVYAATPNDQTVGEIYGLEFALRALGVEL